MPPLSSRRSSRPHDSAKPDQTPDRDFGCVKPIASSPWGAGYDGLRYGQDDSAFVIEHGCCEGIDPGKRIADGARQMSCPDIGKHRLDAGTSYRSLAVVTDPEMIEARLQRSHRHFLWKERCKDPARRRLQHSHDGSNAHHDVDSMVGFLEPDHGWTVRAPHRQRDSVLDLVRKRRDLRFGHPDRR